MLRDEEIPIVPEMLDEELNIKKERVRGYFLEMSRLMAEEGEGFAPGAPHQVKADEDILWEVVNGGWSEMVKAIEVPPEYQDGFEGMEKWFTEEVEEIAQQMLEGHAEFRENIMEAAVIVDNGFVDDFDEGDLDEEGRYKWRDKEWCNNYSHDDPRGDEESSDGGGGREEEDSVGGEDQPEESEEEEGEEENPAEALYEEVYETGLIDESGEILEPKVRGAVLQFAKDVDSITSSEEEPRVEECHAAFNKWMRDNVGESWFRWLYDKKQQEAVRKQVEYMFDNHDEFLETVGEKWEVESEELSGNTSPGANRSSNGSTATADGSLGSFVEKYGVQEGREHTATNGRLETGQSGGGGESVDVDVSDVENELFHGDATELLPAMREEHGRFADALITDVPYGMNYDSRGEDHDVIEADSSVSEAMEVNREVFKQARMVLNRNSPVVTFAGESNLCEMMHLMDKWFDHKQVAIWDKEWVSTSSMAEYPIRYRTSHEYILIGVYGESRVENHKRHEGSIISAQRPSGDNRVHPTEKPIGLMRELVQTFTEEGDLVLEPFAGSGQTCKGAQQTKRTYTGIELDEEYYEKATERLSQETLV